METPGECYLDKEGSFLYINYINPVVALNSALGFIKPLPIEERPLNQCHLLDQSIGDL